TSQMSFVSCTPQTGVNCFWCGMASTACTNAGFAGDTNIVVLTFGGGKPLAAGSSTDLATIVSMAAPGQQGANLFDSQGNYVCGSLATRSETRSNDVVIAGNVTGGATGSAPLFYPAFCGDGVVEPTLGETCDPTAPLNTWSPPAPAGSTCRADCTWCGDGTVQSGSVCTSLNTKFRTCSAGKVGQACLAAGDCDTTPGA